MLTNRVGRHVVHGVGQDGAQRNDVQSLDGLANQGHATAMVPSVDATSVHHERVVGIQRELRQNWIRALKSKPGFKDRHVEFGCEPEVKTNLGKNQL